MSDRWLVIANPAAGGGRCASLYPATLQKLEAAGLQLDVVTTAAPGDATRLAREAWASGTRRFIGVGGDGTSYEIVNGLFPLEGDERPTLGFLPLGTGNSFLRDFSEEPATHAFEALVHGRTRSCDVLRARHADGVLHYINLLSIGFVADVNATTHRRFKRLGEAGYTLGVLTELAGLAPRPFPMAIDGATPVREPLTFASINNSRFTGGKMMMAPFADTGDGRADLVLVGAMGRLRLLTTFPRIFSGTHVEAEGITSEQVQRVTFQLDEPVDVMVDGEVARVQLEAIDVLHGALEVCA